MNQTDMHELARNNQARLMRTYTNVILNHVNDFENLSALELEMLENVEHLKFFHCQLRNTNELVSLLKNCKQLKFVDTDYLKIHDDSEPAEKIQNAVALIVKGGWCPSLQCFANILHIHTRSLAWDNDLQDLALFLSNYATVITTLKYEPLCEGFSQMMLNTPNLKLKHLILNAYGEPDIVSQISQVFDQQKASVTKLKVSAGHMYQQLFDAIRFKLINLETLHIVDALCWTNFRLNDLKVLPKLKNLEVAFKHSDDGYELDLSELRNLEQLQLTMRKKSNLAVTRQNATLKSLKLLLDVDSTLFGQIVRMFPNLVFLFLKKYASTTDKKVEL
jgi:hypothetical protein